MLLQLVARRRADSGVTNGRLPKPRVPQENVEPFSADQIKALIEAAKRSVHPLRDQALLLCLLDTGLRASELCNLAMADLDLPGRRAYILGKGNKQRAVPFSRQTAATIAHYLRREERRDEDPVFINHRGVNRGRPLTVSGLRQLIERLCAAAGIKGGKKSPHRFRHTCALWVLKNGGSIYHVKELLGHSSLTTCQSYLKISQADVQELHQQVSPVENLRKMAKPRSS